MSSECPFNFVTIVTGSTQNQMPKSPIFTFALEMVLWTSLVAQWLRIRLPMQVTRVRALVWEDPTCHRATKPVRHNY